MCLGFGEFLDKVAGRMILKAEMAVAPEASAPLLASVSALDGAAEVSPALLVESVLFVADRPVAVAELAQVLDLDRRDIERALAEIERACAARGVRLQRAGKHVQLVSAPEAAEAIGRFLGLESSTRLSGAALESLSIIAYRQPVTRPEIEALRGVNSDGVLRTLLMRGLVAPIGRRDTVGHPVEYGTTFQFLEYFGLQGLDELPPLAALVEPESVEGGHRNGHLNGQANGHGNGHAGLEHELAIDAAPAAPRD